MCSVGLSGSLHFYPDLSLFLVVLTLTCIPMFPSSPSIPHKRSFLGNALKEQHLIQDAIACYQAAIKLRPDFAIAHGNLGSCYYDLGDYTSAIKAFNYAIQLEPNFPDAYNNLGKWFSLI